MLLKKVAMVTVIVLAVTAYAASSYASDSTFSGTRVTVDSSKSYDQVVDAVKSLVAKNGMMVMAEVNQGQMLSMAGLSLKATVFLVGNPTVGKQLFEQDEAVGLYVPLRVAVYTDAKGKTHVQYDRPSSVLGQFKNEHITMVGRMLDERIAGLASMAAK
jgi:uncharacterized protein (DUF302 family)